MRLEPNGSGAGVQGSPLAHPLRSKGECVTFNSRKGSSREALMGAGIIRVSKVKSSGIGGLHRHVKRSGINHSNPDIDASRSHHNVSWVDRGDTRAFVERRIAEGRTSTRKVRKDAVVLVDGIVTMSEEDARRMGEAAVADYLRDALAFVEDEFGADNIAYFDIHLDETTPHAHFGAVPLRDGSLSWKKFFPSKYALSEFQDRFYQQVSSRHDLDRGEKRVGQGALVRHKTVSEMKADSRRELARIQEQIEQEQRRLESVQRAQETAREQVRGIEEGVRALELRRSELRERRERARERVAELLGRLSRVPADVVDRLSDWSKSLVERLFVPPAQPEPTATALGDLEAARRAAQGSPGVPRQRRGRRL